MVEAAQRPDLGALFTPRVVAVVGASTTRSGPANRFAELLIKFGYDGKIFAVHPTAAEVDGLPAFPTLADIPHRVDYAYVAVPARRMIETFQAAGGNVAFAQILTSGFGEQGDDGMAAQDRLVKVAQDNGVRILGPNCLGTYSPRGGLTFVAGLPREAGSVGVVAQSGGLGVDVLRRGTERGVQFSGLVTLGNSADLGPVDLLEHFMADPETAVIGLHLEHVANGRRLFEVLMEAEGRKPCVLLKGGRTRQGSAAAASHTGALSSDARLWTALARQTGAVLVDTLDEFIDVLAAFQHAPASPHAVTSQVALVGNGGGASVMGSDALARAGLKLPPLTPRTGEALAGLNLAAGTSIVNPVDIPAGAMAQGDGDVMRAVLEILAVDEETQATIVHLNLAVLATLTGDPKRLIANICQAIISSRRVAPDRHIVAALRSDASTEVDAVRRDLAQQLHRSGVPTVGEIDDAARVLAGVRQREITMLRNGWGRP